jgi:hypothetical protein
MIIEKEYIRIIIRIRGSFESILIDLNLSFERILIELKVIEIFKRVGY